MFWLTTTLRDGDCDLLPHFLQHYSKLGVDQFVIPIDIDRVPQDKLPDLESRFPVKFRRAKFLTDRDKERDQFEDSCLEESGCSATDWVLRVDLDEFHDYGALSLEQVTDMGNAIKGTWRDRIANGGILKELDNSPISEQYPWSTRLSAKILGTTGSKVMISRFWVKLHGGRHWALNCRAESPGLIVNHYKWRSSLLKRLEGRFYTIKNMGFRRRHKKFIKWFQKNGNRINLTEIEAEYVG